MSFPTGTESQLDVQPAAEAQFSAPGPGAAPAAGGQSCGQREEAAGQSEGRGEHREEKVPATGAAGAQGEGNGERPAKGLFVSLVGECGTFYKHVLTQFM